MSDGIQVDATGIRVDGTGVLVADSSASCCCSGGPCADCTKDGCAVDCSACDSAQPTPGCYVVTVSGMADCSGVNPDGVFLLTQNAGGGGDCTWYYEDANFNYLLEALGLGYWRFSIDSTPGGPCSGFVWSATTVLGAVIGTPPVYNVCYTDPPTHTGPGGATAVFTYCRCCPCSDPCTCTTSGSASEWNWYSVCDDYWRFKCDGGSSAGAPFCAPCNGVDYWWLPISGGTCQSNFPVFGLQCPVEDAPCNVNLKGPIATDDPEGSYSGYTCGTCSEHDPLHSVTGSGTVSDCTDGI